MPPTGQRFTVDDAAPLGAGGEARICMVQHDSALVAKIYHRPTESHAHKLGVMLTNPPIDPVTTQQRPLIAWPLDLLNTVDGNRRMVGFLMQRVSGMSPIIDFYHPRTRLQQRPWFDYSRLHLAARNIAAAVHALHSRGYVRGQPSSTWRFYTFTLWCMLWAGRATKRQGGQWSIPHSRPSDPEPYQLKVSRREKREGCRGMIYAES
jgi:hypothetical protein